MGALRKRGFVARAKSREPRLYLRGGVWWCSFYDAEGRRTQTSTRCLDRAAAIEAARRLERAAQTPHDPAAHKTLGDALTLMLEDRADQAARGKKSPATVRFYEQKAGHLLRVYEYPKGPAGEHIPLPLKNLNASKVDEYIEVRRREKAHPNTLAKEIVTLRAALKLARRRGWYPYELDQVMPVGYAPEYRPRTRALAVGELSELLAQLSPDRAARVAFAVATSACLGETDRARREDVDSQSGLVFLRGTKRASRRRTVPLVTPWQKQLVAYALQHAEGEGGLLLKPWGKITRDLAAACKRASIAKVSSNDLRRTTAQWLRAQGAPPDLIAAVMGHTSSRMVELVYGRLSPEILAERLSRALYGAHSFASPDDCNTGVSVVVAAGGVLGRSGQLGVGEHKIKNPGSRDDLPGFLETPAVGLEPTTRGLTVWSLKLPSPRTDSKFSLERDPTVTPVSRLVPVRSRTA